jgi:peroxiredoxin
MSMRKRRQFSVARQVAFEKICKMKGAAAILFLALFAFFSFTLKTELRHESSPIAALRIGDPMPDFTLADLSGKTWTLSEIIPKKKIVMINFWASWCGPCRMEMPGFEKLYAAQKNNGFIILAIAEDKERADLDEYLKKKPVSFPVLVDQKGALLKKFNIESLPTTVLVGGDGKIKQVHEGVQRYLEYSVQTALKHPER